MNIDGFAGGNAPTVKPATTTEPARSYSMTKSYAVPACSVRVALCSAFPSPKKLPPAGAPASLTIASPLSRMHELPTPVIPKDQSPVWSGVNVVRATHPSVLIGTSGDGGFIHNIFNPRPASEKTGAAPVRYELNPSAQ